MDTLCSYCRLPIPSWVNRCPHCARPSLFPNVAAADHSDERRALDDRYRAAVDEAASRGAHAAVKEFERLVSRSVIVINRSLIDAMKLATTDHEVYGTYYKLIEAGVRLPEDNKWDSIRSLVDSALFPHYKDEIRFGSLSLDGAGLTRFGPCVMVLKTELIEYRASFYEENSILFFARQGIRIVDAADLPKGYRSTWSERHRHAVAKLSRRIDASTSATDFPSLLLREDPAGAQTDFIEAHLYGPMTIRTIERLGVKAKLSRAERRMLAGLRERLANFGVTLETV